MRSRYFWVKRVVWGAVATVFFLVGLAILLSYIFEDKVKALAIKEVNKYLVAKVIINGEDINFSFIQDFPMASVNFNNFIIQDPIADGKLAEAKNLSVQFNPFDLWFGKYQIKKIILKDATLNLKIDKQGKANYIIWKTDSTSKGENAPIALQLKNITLLRVKVNYDDAQSSLQFENNIKEALLTGKLYDEKFLLESKADIYFSRFSMNKVQYIKHQQIIFDAALDMDMPAAKYTIKQGKATINGADFDVTGFAQNLSKSVKIDYTVKSRQNKIQTLLALMPEEYAKLFKDYESEGNIYFTAKIKGLISDKENPAINVNYGVSNGRLVDKVNDIALEHINCQGMYTNGKKHTLEDSEAELKNFSCVLKGKKIKASVYGRNLLDPYVRGQLSGSVSLADVKHFLPLTYIDKLEGLVQGDVSFKGRINDLKTPASRSKVFVSGKMQMKEVAMQSKQYGADYSKMNGSFVFDGNNLHIVYFNGMAKSSDFTMTGNFNNLAAFLLLPNQNLAANAQFHSNLIMLEDFIVEKPATAKKGATQEFTFPGFLLANMDVTIDKLTFRHVTATQLSGDVYINQDKMKIKNGRMQTFGGLIQLDGEIASLPKNRLRTAFTTSCKDIDVSQLFYGLENFGQNNLTDKNIKGTITSKTVFSLNWNADLSPDLASAVATSDFVIDNGKLQNLEPLVKLGKFTSIKGLNDLSFSRMTNQIYVRNQQLIIPQMDIKSSAMDMTVAGTHTFNNEMDYHITMNASQLVFGKKQNYEDEFGEVEVNEKGGALVFVHMTGTASDPKFRYDGANAKKHIVNNIKDEAKEINKVLNGSDTGPDGTKREDLNKPKDDYDLQWEDEDKAPKTQQLNTTTEPKNNDAGKAWKDFKKKLSTQNK